MTLPLLRLHIMTFSCLCLIVSITSLHQHIARSPHIAGPGLTLVLEWCNSCDHWCNMVISLTCALCSALKLVSVSEFLWILLHTMRKTLVWFTTHFVLFFRDSKLARQFREAFPDPAPFLPEVLSHFSLPISLGDLKDSISDEVCTQTLPTQKLLAGGGGSCVGRWDVD